MSLGNNGLKGRYDSTPDVDNNDTTHGTSSRASHIDRNDNQEAESSWDVQAFPRAYKPEGISLLEYAGRTRFTGLFPYRTGRELAIDFKVSEPTIRKRISDTFRMWFEERAQNFWIVAARTSSLTPEQIPEYAFPLAHRLPHHTSPKWKAMVATRFQYTDWSKNYAPVFHCGGEPVQSTITYTPAEPQYAQKVTYSSTWQKDPSPPVAISTESLEDLDLMPLSSPVFGNAEEIDGDILLGVYVAGNFDPYDPDFLPGA